MSKGFEGKVALVTGASGGIGRASALAFAAAGAQVVVSDVNEQGGTETVDLILAAGGAAVFQRCDVSKADDVKALVRRAVSEYGRLDCALNNAGINNLGSNEYEDDVYLTVCFALFASPIDCYAHCEMPLIMQYYPNVVNNNQLLY